MNMYNMDISIGSYKFRIEIILLIIVVSWIMFGHILCSCCTMSLKEGVDTMSETIGETVDAVADQIMDETTDQNKNTIVTNGTTDETVMNEEDEEVIDTFTGYMAGNNSAYGPEFSSSDSSGYIMKPDTWGLPTLIYSKGTVPDAGIQSIMNRPRQPIPLPEGELSLFATTPFKPECCPNTYSSSEGCACMTTEQYGYLKNRGGNNVPYSEY
jgi:hypothetical protein